jgi:glyceraldehyde 3-phosphate dehydrogenase
MTPDIFYKALADDTRLRSLLLITQKVLHESIGIKHGSMTTIHDITNTQTIIDAPHKDLRRACACGTSLISITTGSATAITHIFPELKGKLNGVTQIEPQNSCAKSD